MNFEKTVGLTNFRKPLLQSVSSLQVSPSMSTLISSFTFLLLLTPAFNVLSDYFYVSLNLVALPNVRLSKRGLETIFRVRDAQKNCFLKKHLKTEKIKVTRLKNIPYHGSWPYIRMHENPRLSKSPCSYFIWPAGRITAVTTNTGPAVW